MLEPVRTKAERQRQGEESGNRVSTSTKNRQRAGRGRAEAATGRAAQDLGRREAATLTKWARWALRLPLYKNDAAWSLFLISDRIVPMASSTHLFMHAHLSPKDYLISENTQFLAPSDRNRLVVC